MSEDPVYRRGDVLWRRTHDRIVLLVPTTGEFVSLKATGRDLWTALETPGSVAELAGRMAALYSAPAERIAADIAPVVEQLKGCGGVTVTDTSP